MDIPTDPPPALPDDIVAAFRQLAQHRAERADAETVDETIAAAIDALQRMAANGRIGPGPGQNPGILTFAFDSTQVRGVAVPIGQAILGYWPVRLGDGEQEDAELSALSACIAALDELQPAAWVRCARWLADRANALDPTTNTC